MLNRREDPIHEAYQRARRRARWRPSFLLRRREAQIIARRPRPSDVEMAELRAVRQVLRVRHGPLP